MTVWEIFRHKSPELQKVTTGRFEIERDAEVAYLEYSMSGNIRSLLILKSLRNCAVRALLPLWQKRLSTSLVRTI
jgi:hypothetical protein